MVTFDLVLYILAFVCFVLAALKINEGRVGLLAAGLAALTLSLFV